MAFTLNFDQLIKYDVGQPGITLPATLKLINKSVDIVAKLDTGSTDCIFTRSVGEELGLVIEDGELTYIGTAAGRFPAYLHEITLSVLDYDFDAFVYFAAEEHFNRNILGRFGFLDRVQIGLIDYEGELYISRYF
jgi:hypothetical protein